jgi:hypothetical protein
MAEKNSDQGETEHKEAAVLPAREAMTILSSTSGEESVTSEDRSEPFESDDSAPSQT